MPALAQKRRGGVDMTEGSISRHLIRFAAPLLIGNIFQQLYNTVDSWVVGNYVGDNAFSAVGTAGPIVFLLVGFFMGLSSGAGVVISQYYGAGNTENVKKAVHTALLLTFTTAVLFTFLGMLLVPSLLVLMKTPDEVFPEAKQYLTVYFAGVAGLMIYNMGSGILRAIGDSRRPFYFLAVSAVTNVVLDLAFVLGLGMGVEGVAYATAIAQAISAILVLITLATTKSCVRISLRDFRFDTTMLKQIISMGLPAALQMTITAFSNIFVQGYINFFGAGAMGGWTAYAKLDQLMILPIQSLALASTTFVGQNLGCGQVERAKKGVRTALIVAAGVTVAVMIPVVIFAPALTAFFNDAPAVVKYGGLLLRVQLPFYLLCCFNQIYAGALRGAGDSRAPMVIMLMSFVLFRQAYLFVVSHISNTFIPIVLSYPAGWLLASVLLGIYYHRTDLSKKRLVKLE